MPEIIPGPTTTKTMFVLANRSLPALYAREYPEDSREAALMTEGGLIQVFVHGQHGMNTWGDQRLKIVRIQPGWVWVIPISAENATKLYYENNKLSLGPNSDNGFMFETEEAALEHIISHY